MIIVAYDNRKQESTRKILVKYWPVALIENLEVRISWTLEYLAQRLVAFIKNLEIDTNFVESSSECDHCRLSIVGNKEQQKLQKPMKNLSEKIDV